MTTSDRSGSSAFELLDERVKRWIWQQDWTELRSLQEQAIPAILARARDVILSAPTAGGKTEAAFFPILTRIAFTPQPSVRALYISPLKALINDQFGRLDGLCELLEIPVHRWHGDVGQNAKNKLLKQPNGVLLITPESTESLFVNHGGALRRVLSHLDYVVIDELHSFIGTERGAQLRSLLARIEDLLGRKVIRVGLSATLADMGLAAKFLRWEDPANVMNISVEGGGELKAQIRAYVNPSADKSLAGELPTADEQIERHVFEKTRSGNHLIFANSRSRVETFTDALHDIASTEGVPDVYLAHHGNLSKELREDAENRLRNKERPAVCVCTSTLELGIDIGAMNSVAQIGPPPSVASLRQRVGRSGRRGEAAVLRMYAVEDEITGVERPTDRLRLSLIQEIAALQLMIEKWCEPPHPSQPHFSTLVQQILSVVLERSGISVLDLFRLLCSAGAFRSVKRDAFVELLKSMKAKDLIQQMDDGTLLLSKKGERITAHYSFYAVFETSEEFRVIHGSRNLGTMPVETVLRPNDYIVFGGKRWRVIAVDEEQRIILVEPSTGGKAPVFGGEGGSTHTRVRQLMQQILSDPTMTCDYLDDKALQLLTEARSNYATLGLGSNSILATGDYTYAFHWRGDREALALALMFAERGIQCHLSNVALAVRAPIEQVVSALEDIARSAAPDPVELASSSKMKRVNKYDWALPDLLLDEEFAIRELDVDGAIQIALELVGRSPSLPQSVSSKAVTSQGTCLQVLAGSESIGGTKILLSELGEDVLLDFGLDFHQYGIYFEEFLRPRSTRGLVDLWHFGLIPRLNNAYRNDLMPLGDEFNSTQEVNPVGILLSHAHVDHFGMIGTLRADIPLHASPESLAIIKASQDSGRLDFWGEAIYVKERAPSDKDGRALRVRDARIGRECHSIGSLRSELTDFLTTLPSDESTRNLTAGKIIHSSNRIGQFAYTSWNVDHSLPGCIAFCIETNWGRIAYTGDLRFHGKRADSTHAFAQALALSPPDLLICEGTQVSRDIPNETTEQQVCDAALEIVKGAGGRLVIADFGPRHVERLQTFLDIAERTQRRLVITTKDAYLLRSLESANPDFSILQSPRVVIYDEIRGTTSKWEEGIKDEFDGRLVEARAIRSQHDWYILAFSFFDCNELIDLHPENAVYIYSGSEAYSEDQMQDLTRLWAWCQEFHMTVHGFRPKLDDQKFEFPDNLNASGHATKADIKWLIETARPKRLLPVHRSSTTGPWFEAICKALGTEVLHPDSANGYVRLN